MKIELPGLVLDYQFETNSGCTVDSVTHAVYHPDGVAPGRKRYETWESNSKTIGQGAQGAVFLQRRRSGRDRHGHGSVRAVKVIPYLENDTRNRHIREIEAMVRFSHERHSRFLVKFSGWYVVEGGGRLCIAMEYMRHGDLQMYMSHRNAPLDEYDARQIIYQVLQGLEAMHRAGYAHRDVKPHNVLIKQLPKAHGSRPWWVKLSDFGLTKPVDATTTNIAVGTKAYMAPELLDAYLGAGRREARQKTKVNARLTDIWAVGVMSFYLVTKDEAFRAWRDPFTAGNVRIPYGNHKVSLYHAETRLSRVTGGFRSWLGPAAAASTVPGLLARNRYLSSTNDHIQLTSSGVRFIIEATRDTPRKRLKWTKAIKHDWLRRCQLEYEQNADSQSSFSLCYSSVTTGVATRADEKGLTTVTEASTATEEVVRRSLYAPSREVLLREEHRTGQKRDRRVTMEASASGTNTEPRGSRSSQLASPFPATTEQAKSRRHDVASDKDEAAQAPPPKDSNARHTSSQSVRDMRYPTLRETAYETEPALSCAGTPTDDVASNDENGARTGSGKDVSVQAAPRTLDSSRLGAVEERTKLLYKAVRDGQLNVIEPLVDELGASVKYLIMRNGTSPLHVAAAAGHVDVIDYLVRKGASVSALDIHLRQPLHEACDAGHVEAVQALLRHRADVQQVYGEEQAPLLHLAARTGRCDMIRFLLGLSGVRRRLHQRCKYGLTALHNAVLSGNAEAVRLLLEAGADLDAKSHQHETPLNMAAAIHEEEIMKLLIEWQAEKHCPTSPVCIAEEKSILTPV